MPPSASPRLLPGSLGRLVLVVRVLCLLGVVTLIGVPLWFWSSADNVRGFGPQLAAIGQVLIDERAMRLGALATVLPVSVGLFALWQLWRLFAEYSVGRVFSRAALGHLRRFAWTLLAAALLAPVMRSVMSVVFTLSNPPGQRMLALSLSWSDYLAVLLAVVLIAIATVMAEAVRVAEENEGFV
ncbi:MAG TPA: DUF2975 domain-containing protein [Piscinibacter sp.]|uniref:DUF2975 domain-containing protein n=1 Tax=Piscinibacter sp. TaxID=1903157 RepID=UPI0011D55ADD|nr:MAG: DUF2975 domain-containing protein [Burkholderiaceae bacterium]HNK20019.1 DUF2975 domain-containing protein [Piscinibacter sp.]